MQKKQKKNLTKTKKNSDYPAKTVENPNTFWFYKDFFGFVDLGSKKT